MCKGINPLRQPIYLIITNTYIKVYNKNHEMKTRQIKLNSSKK